MSEFTITKRYGRKLSGNWKSATFETEISRTIEATCPEDLVAAGEKLFNQAKALTELDIEREAETLQQILGPEKK